MDENRNEWSRIILVVFLLALVGVIVYVIATTITAEGEKTKQESGEVTKTTTQKENKKMDEDSSTAVLKKVNTETKTITVYRIDRQQDEMFSYSGATNVKDEFGQIRTIDQIELGEIVDLYGLNKNTITALQISSKAWEYTGVNLRKMSKTEQIIRIGDTNYQYSEGMVIFNGEKQIPYIELTDQDEITVRGIDKTIHSLSLSKGHGYIRFVNYKDFYGGMVEVGRSIILPISEDMLITAREGTYRIAMEKGTLSGSKEIKVIRDQEMIVDMKDFKKEAEKVGKVTFRLNPNGAALFVDGSEVDYDEPVVLSYGKHNVEAHLDGYVTYTNILKVTENKMTLKIKLLETEVEEKEEPENKDTEKETPDSSDDKNEEESTDQGGYKNTAAESGKPEETEVPDEEDSDEQDTDKPTETTEPKTEEEPEIDTTVDHTVIIAEPVGADVYLDGIKKGISPVEFTAKGGSHIVTFYKAGYDTKSYPIDITGSMSFHLPDMVKSR